MALANVGYLLAGRLSLESRGVLMVDWDLEAPGLHRYFETDQSRQSLFRKNAILNSREADTQLGLIDFFEYADSLYPRSDAPIGEDIRLGIHNRIFDNFSRFVRPTHVDKLSILQAGRFDASYPERIRHFDWERFHQRDPLFFRSFRYFLMDRHDFVLIDSRTGLTDTSGICVQLMPEKLVLVFAPNRQNIEGIVNVSIQSGNFRKESPDPRPLIIFPLASRIDGTNDRLRKIWRQGGVVDNVEIPGYQKIFESLFIELYNLDKCDLGPYFDATQIKHDSDYSYGEKIAAQLGTTERLSLGFTFADFTRRLVTLDAPWESLSEEIAMEEARQREIKTSSWATQVVRQAKTLTAASLIAASITILLFVGVSLDNRAATAERKIAVLENKVSELQASTSSDQNKITELQKWAAEQFFDTCINLKGRIDFSQKTCVIDHDGQVIRFRQLTIP
jgi:hypothetical protein